MNNRPSTSYGDSSFNKYNARYPARDVESNRVSPHSYRQGRRRDLNESGSQERMVNQNGSRESQENVDARSHSFEEDMEIGYEESGPSEMTFERLEQKFQDEIMRSMKEQGDLEDEEIVRHKERMLEINTQYQERVTSLRVQHATRLGELLRKESQARLNHYQQAAMSTHKTERGPTEPRDYDWSMSRRYGTMPDDCYRSMRVEPPRPYGIMATEPLRPYGTTPDESYREHSRYREAEKSRVSEERVPIPYGRVYNNLGAHR